MLRHRIMTNFNAEADGPAADQIVRRLMELVPAGLKVAAPEWTTTCSSFDPRDAGGLSGLGLQARLSSRATCRAAQSPYHGFSVEFAEHREYVPGDDTRHSTGRSSANRSLLSEAF